jgi:hypothetical protein
MLGISSHDLSNCTKAHIDSLNFSQFDTCADAVYFSCHDHLSIRIAWWAFYCPLERRIYLAIPLLVPPISFGFNNPF